MAKPRKFIHFSWLKLPQSHPKPEAQGTESDQIRLDTPLCQGAQEMQGALPVLNGTVSDFGWEITRFNGHD
jgi:hypothetical protein